MMMATSDRPIVMALVALTHNQWVLGREPTDKVTSGGPIPSVTLVEAKEFADNGWTVIVDPWTMEDLVRWEQRQRIPPVKWFGQT